MAFSDLFAKFRQNDEEFEDDSARKPRYGYKGSRL